MIVYVFFKLTVYLTHTVTIAVHRLSLAISPRKTEMHRKVTLNFQSKGWEIRKQQI